MSPLILVATLPIGFGRVLAHSYELRRQVLEGIGWRGCRVFVTTHCQYCFLCLAFVHESLAAAEFGRGALHAGPDTFHRGAHALPFSRENAEKSAADNSGRNALSSEYITKAREAQWVSGTPIMPHSRSLLARPGRPADRLQQLESCGPL